MRRRSFLGVTSASLLGLAGCMGATEYTVTDVSVGDVSAPFDFSIEIVDPDAVVDHPARLSFSVSNEGEQPIQIRNTGIWPFGLLELADSLGAEGAAGTILWTERYAQSDEVDATNRRDYGTSSTPLVQPLDPGKRISETYELHGDSLGVNDTGRQVVRGEFQPPILEYATDEEDRWESFLPQISVVIQKKSVI
ncbi:hypothetical protein [Salinigranum sp. GCM10025319]|uniref:hypothetical protein n=1 Tax=Salinigranum sp. GCM10025319 TaxID=3252687 RepID=UPI003612E1F3